MINVNWNNVLFSLTITVLQSTVRSPVYYTYICRHASALDTWAVFHTTRMQGQYTSQNEHFTYTRISRSAYGFGILVVTCLHTSEERMQILCTSCIRILYKAPIDLHTEDRQDRYTRYIRLNPIYASNYLKWETYSLQLQLQYKQPK